MDVNIDLCDLYSARIPTQVWVCYRVSGYSNSKARCLSHVKWKNSIYLLGLSGLQKKYMKAYGMQEINGTFY